MVSKKKKIASKKKNEKVTILGFIKKHEADLILVLIPAILLLILQIVTVLLSNIDHQAQAVAITTRSLGNSMTDYTFFARPISPPLSAEAAIIVDRDSKNILFEKNSQLKFSMASTTKVMTALVALDYFKQNDILTAVTSHAEGVNVGVEVGDRLYFKDALYAMLLPSGNDIALMIAQNYPGGEDAFVKAMNKKASSLHLANTHYADPAGLNDDGNYTTARELSQLAIYATQNEVLADVTATKSKIVQTVDDTKIFTLTNLNQLLGQYGVVGMKTGHTEGAGDVLITSAVDNGHHYIIVVMRSQDRFADTQLLLSSLLTDVTSFSPRVFVD